MHTTTWTSTKWNRLQYHILYTIFHTNAPVRSKIIGWTDTSREILKSLAATNSPRFWSHGLLLHADWWRQTFWGNLRPLYPEYGDSTFRRNVGRVQLKCDGTRWRPGGEVKGKLANGVGSQYSSHYLGTWCIQHYYHYYRWCAHFGCQ